MVAERVVPGLIKFIIIIIIILLYLYLYLCEKKRNIFGSRHKWGQSHLWIQLTADLFYASQGWREGENRERDESHT